MRSTILSPDKITPYGNQSQQSITSYGRKTVAGSLKRTQTQMWRGPNIDFQTIDTIFFKF